MVLSSLSKYVFVAGLSISALSYGADKASSAAKAATPAVATSAATSPAAVTPAAAAPTATSAPATATTTAATPMASKAAKSHSYTGMVISTDAVANSIVIKGMKGEQTFNLAATGKVMQGKNEMKLADLTKDQKVTVKYTEEAGAKTASQIKISAAPVKKEAKTSTAAAPQ